MVEEGEVVIDAVGAGVVLEVTVGEGVMLDVGEAVGEELEAALKLEVGVGDTKMVV